jgi:hypothetical protein
MNTNLAKKYEKNRIGSSEMLTNTTFFMLLKCNAVSNKC